MGDTRSAVHVARRKWGAGRSIRLAFVVVAWVCLAAGCDKDTFEPTGESFEKFHNYKDRALEVEAEIGLSDLYRGAATYSQSEIATPDGLIESGLFPAAHGCTAGGERKKVRAEATDWEAEPWPSLRFHQPRDHRYRFCYRPSEDRLRFAATAEADIDKDGVIDSVFCVRAEVPAMDEPLPFVDALEVESAADCVP